MTLNQYKAQVDERINDKRQAIREMHDIAKEVFESDRSYLASFNYNEMILFIEELTTLIHIRKELDLIEMKDEV